MNKETDIFLELLKMNVYQFTIKYHKHAMNKKALTTKIISCFYY